jgi:hypothetical protein
MWEDAQDHCSLGICKLKPEGDTAVLPLRRLKFVFHYVPGQHSSGAHQLPVFEGSHLPLLTCNFWHPSARLRRLLNPTVQGSVWCHAALVRERA